MTIIELNPTHRWECPNCDYRRVTHTTERHLVVHTCPGLGNLTVQMVREGTDCKIEVKLREDYVGDQVPHYDNDGRPVMSIVTTRDDGQDCAILAPLATLRGVSHGLG